MTAQTGKLTIHCITPKIFTQNTWPLLDASAAGRHLQEAQPIVKVQ